MFRAGVYRRTSFKMWRCFGLLSCLFAIICGKCEAFNAALKWSEMCFSEECCTDSYINFNAEGLKRSLTSKVYGQHIAIPTVLSSVKSHINNKNPSKPLVLSFHGWSGIGKSFVSRIIIENLYEKGEKSSYVHMLNSEIHFKHSRLVSEYKDQLHHWIYHNVSSCGRSIFIFEEMDHMPEGMIDVLTPFLEYSTHVDKVDFRKTIFIFISNTGGDEINKLVSQHWHAGKSREDIKLRDMQEILQLSAYNQKSGLKRSKLVHKQLIDHFIPFMPLERDHVRGCIIDEFRKQNITAWTQDHVKEVLKEFVWYPNETNLYSTSGCKKVAQKIALLNID